MNRFKNTYNLGNHWFNKFKRHYKDLYKFVFDSDEEVYIVFNRNKEHVLTYDPYDETVYTDIPTTNLYESLGFERYKDPKRALGLDYNKTLAEKILSEWDSDYNNSRPYGGFRWISYLFAKRVLELIQQGKTIDEALDSKKFKEVKNNIFFECIEVLKKMGIKLPKLLESNFERYKDPKVALGLNAKEHNKKIAKEYYDKEWHDADYPDLNQNEISKLGSILQLIGKHDYTMEEVLSIEDASRWKNNPEFINILLIIKQLEEIGLIINHDLIKESNFERYKDPKVALGLNHNAEIAKNAMDTINFTNEYSASVAIAMQEILRNIEKGENIENVLDNYLEKAESIKGSGGRIAFHDILAILYSRLGMKLSPKLNKILSNSVYGFDIKESIGFERYRDPKKALGLDYNIGKAQELLNDKLEFERRVNFNYHVGKVLYPILQDIIDGKDANEAIFDRIDEAGWFENMDTYTAEKRQYKLLKILIDEVGLQLNDDFRDMVARPQNYFEFAIKESNFERYKDPKQALGLNYNAEKAKEAIERWDKSEFGNEYTWEENKILHYILPRIAKGEKFIDAISDTFSSYSKTEDDRETFRRILWILYDDVGIQMSQNWIKLLQNPVPFLETGILESNFERYKDPKVALGLNIMYEIEKYLKDTGWELASNDYLWICARAGKEDFVEYLLNKGATQDQLNKSLEKALDYNKTPNAKIINMLLIAGAKPDNRTEMFWDRIMKNLKNDDIEIFNLLRPFLDESVSFERYKDPKKALGLTPDEYNIEIIDKFYSTTKTKTGLGIERPELGPLSRGNAIDTIFHDMYFNKLSVNDAVNKYYLYYAAIPYPEYIKILFILKEIGIILPKNLIELMEKERKLVKEDMGGVSAPMATLTNTPGMGNAVPASSAATTGAQFTGSGVKGSGDKWSNVIGGKPYTQAGTLKRKKKKIKEAANINPNDKIGVSMAKKMKVPMTFTKKTSKNQNAIKQKKFEHQILTFEEYYDKLNENNK